MITLKGQSTSFAVNGGAVHSFEIPLDREQMTPKIGKAFGALEAARDAEVKAAKDSPRDRAAQAEANDAVHAALNALYDTAAAGAKATREHAAEQYDVAIRRYGRAIEAAQQALQDAATAAQVHHQAAAGHGIGIDSKATTRAVVTAHALSEQLDKLDGLVAIDEPVLGGRR